MSSQNFNPHKFVDKVKDFCGYSKPRLETVREFAVFIGDEVKLNRCLNYIKDLTEGLPQEKRNSVFSWIIALPHLLEEEQKIKADRDKKYLRLKKKTAHHFEKFKKAIELIKTLEPEQSKFDESYLLNLAKKRSTLWKVRSTFPSPKMLQAKEGCFLAEQIASTDHEKGNPKGSYIISNFIFDVYKKVEKYGMKKSKICTYLGKLLRIVTGKEYSRENVQGILSRPLYTKGIRFRYIDSYLHSWPK